ncbi:MAG: biopolymer transporter ExbD [Bdellovibrionota bacterium]
MLIESRALVPGTFNRHLVARAHRKSTRRKMLLVGLTLTSMVDMFSLLVIFLLQTFSTSPDLLIIAKGVTLPTAITGREIKDAPALSISTAGVFLDQKLVGKTNSLLKDPTPLMERLADLRSLWQKSHPKEKFRGEINLQADRELPSTIVSQFMAILPSQSYGSIQLAVVPGGTGH